MGVLYRDRIVDAELGSRLEATGAVLIEGPRGCGKTETARRTARSEVRLDVDDEARSAAVVAPAVLLDGEKPRLIDEWQLVPAVWDHIRRDVDEHPDQAGRYILTGSAVATDNQVRHSGGLRFTRLRMRPMSLSETGHSSGDVSLSGLFAGEAPRAGDPGLTIHEIAERVSVGGWPGLLGRSTDQALMALRGFLDETSRVDLHRLDGVRRDPENVARVLRSLARNISTQASARAIAADVSGAEEAIDHHTVLSYVAALTRLFVIEDLPAWSPALRSRSILRQARTHHFVDPSLAVAALDADPARLLRDIETLGLLFESLVVRDLRIYAQGLGANVYHYRDNTGLEADAIVQRRDGAWAAFEVKLGQRAIDGAAAALLRLAERVDVERHGRPAALAVITGWGYAYRRADGVDVIPSGTLAP
ncbi:MAG: DUF4143 domain-containing protein [Chloroflexota bacterium]|nr:DUF4143 domain-containing protein [Chloroflexota bacterium]